MTAIAQDFAKKGNYIFDEHQCCVAATVIATGTRVFFEFDFGAGKGVVCHLIAHYFYLKGKTISIIFPQDYPYE
jgi:hypothetical protein